MSETTRRLSLVAAASLLTVACTVHKTETPALSGPSEFALSLLLQAVPDSINQDGASQSAVVAFVHDAFGQPKAGVALRADISVGGTVQDFGQLSARTLVTGADGKASTIYTAPPPSTVSGGLGTRVQVIVTPIGDNFQAAALSTVDIRLVPPGTILPPATVPAPCMTISPSTPTSSSPAQFLAGTVSGGVCGAVTSNIVKFDWLFGDGGTGSGKLVTHAYATGSTYSVTLTETSDRGLTASVTNSVSVSTAVSPVASFTFSPSTPTADQAVTFDGSRSTVAPGQTVTDYGWTFGDGTPVVHTTSRVIGHTYGFAGTFAANLTITDSTGRTGSTSNAITVTASDLTYPVAFFSFTPSPAPVNVEISFDATGTKPSTDGSSVSIRNFQWDFGDGTVQFGAANAGAVGYTYRTRGTYVVKLTVTNEHGKSASTTRSIVVQ